MKSRTGRRRRKRKVLGSMSRFQNGEEQKQENKTRKAETETKKTKQQKQNEKYLMDGISSPAVIEDSYMLYSIVKCV